MWVRPLGQKDGLEEEVATHSSIPAWKIPWKRSLVGYSPWSQQESGLSTCTQPVLRMATHSSTTQTAGVLKDTGTEGGGVLQGCYVSSAQGGSI